MSDFNPGEEWREVDDLNDFRQPDRTGKALVEYDGAVIAHVWIPEETIPPLPTEPDTVIAPHWRLEVLPQYLRGEKLWTPGPGEWYDDRGHFIDSASLAERITGFKVLAEPYAQGANLTLIERVRRETAKAVLERIAPLWEKEFSHSAVDYIASEFGVSDE